ncbi:MAG: cupin domain-containing protein [Chloroflexi bacterium]|nr:cupin domain-containing protein [Chloroflexota bacterium]
MKILAPGTEHTSIRNRYLRADYSTWQPGQECEVHSHDDAAEVFVFLSGECEITVEGETRVVSAGCTVYVGPGEKHKLKVPGNRPMEMFLAVMPNHEPTHTFYRADGTPYHRNRQAP